MLTGFISSRISPFKVYQTMFCLELDVTMFNQQACTSLFPAPESKNLLSSTILTHFQMYRIAFGGLYIHTSKRMYITCTMPSANVWFGQGLTSVVHSVVDLLSFVVDCFWLSTQFFSLSSVIDSGCLPIWLSSICSAWLLIHSVLFSQ